MSVDKYFATFQGDELLSELNDKESNFLLGLRNPASAIFGVKAIVFTTAIPSKDRMAQRWAQSAMTQSFQLTV